jgi:hypothetical protein
MQLLNNNKAIVGRRPIMKINFYLADVGQVTNICKKPDEELNQ